MGVVARNLAAAVISVSGALGGCASNPFKTDTTETHFTIESAKPGSFALLHSKKTYDSIEACQLDGFNLARIEIGDRFNEAVKSAQQAAAARQTSPVIVKQYCYSDNESRDQTLVGPKPRVLAR